MLTGLPSSARFAPRARGFSRVGIGVVRFQFAPRARGVSVILINMMINTIVRPASAGVFRAHASTTPVLASSPREHRIQPVRPASAGVFRSSPGAGRGSSRSPRERVFRWWHTGCEPPFAPRARGFSKAAPRGRLHPRVRPASAGGFRDTYQHDDQHYRSPRERGGFPPPSNGRYLKAWFAPRARGFSHIHPRQIPGSAVRPASAGGFLKIDCC